MNSEMRSGNSSAWSGWQPVQLLPDSPTKPGLRENAEQWSAYKSGHLSSLPRPSSCYYLCTILSKTKHFFPPMVSPTSSTTLLLPLPGLGWDTVLPQQRLPIAVNPSPVADRYGLGNRRTEAGRVHSC